MATFDEFSEQFTPRIRGILDEVLGGGISQGYFLGQLATDIRKQIVFRSRRGFGVKTFGAPIFRFPRLSRDYIEYRKQSRSEGILSPRTTPRRSNITFTGQMLDSILSKTPTVGQILLFFRDDEAEYKALQLHDNRRPFFFLSRSELNYVRTEVDAELVKQIATNLRDF